jgi:site-specific recombinase
VAKVKLALRGNHSVSACVFQKQRRKKARIFQLFFIVCQFEREEAVELRFLIFLTSNVKKNKYINFFFCFVRLCDRAKFKRNLQGRLKLRTEASSPQVE